MNDLSCVDCYGNTIYYFTQWDMNQKMYIRDSGLTKAPEFHFQNKNTPEAIVVRSRFVNGELVVDVPNQLLMESYPLTIYVYATKDGISYKSLYSLMIPVRKRQQPSNYVYSENINNIDYSTVKGIQEKIDELNILLDELTNRVDNIGEDYVFVEDDDTSSGDGSTDGTITDTQYSKTYLYQNGVTSDIVGDWVTMRGSTQHIIEIQSDKLYFHSHLGDSGFSQIITKNELSIEDYDRFGIEYKMTYDESKISNSSYGVGNIMASVEHSNVGISGTGGFPIPLNTSLTTYTVDLSTYKASFKNMKYLSLLFSPYTEIKNVTDVTWEITALWLEKAIE